jgi:hypothetical protein
MKQNKKIFRLILDLIDHKGALAFWYIIRLLSALLPLYSIYLFSLAIKLLETHAPLTHLFYHLLLILFIRLLDNYSRLISIYKLEHLIFNIEFSIHQFLLFGIKAKNKNERHKIIQAVRNFSEAVRNTFAIVRQPGIDGLVSFISTPIILIFLDFRVFVAEMAYIAIYCFVDVYTTQRYSRFRNVQNLHTEKYYAHLQDSNHVETERRQFLNHLKKMCNWGFLEWNFLQGTAVFFYSLILFYLVYTVSIGQNQISDLILIMGYITNTQVFLNNLSSIKDILADTKVALTRLAKNRSISAVNFSDLT